MAIDGVVKQIDYMPKNTCGVVTECTAIEICMKANPDYKQGQAKKCQLSVEDHGTRCSAYPQDQNMWVVNADLTAKMMKRY